MSREHKGSEDNKPPAESKHLPLAANNLENTMIINHSAVRRMLQKREVRSGGIGWVDYSPGSWDWRVAVARLHRISDRLRGRRITFAQALREYT